MDKPVMTAPASSPATSRPIAGTTNIPGLRLHNQYSPATRRSVGELVAHMGAVQAQDFAGGPFETLLRYATRSSG